MNFKKNKNRRSSLKISISLFLLVFFLPSFTAKAQEVSSLAKNFWAAEKSIVRDQVLPIIERLQAKDWRDDESFYFTDNETMEACLKEKDEKSSEHPGQYSVAEDDYVSCLIESLNEEMENFGIKVNLLVKSKLTEKEAVLNYERTRKENKELNCGNRPDYFECYGLSAKALSQKEVVQSLALEANTFFVLPQRPGAVPRGDLLEDFIPQLVRLLFRFASLAVFVSFVISGLMFVAALGNEERVTKAKQMLYWTLVGFAFVTLAFALVKAITDIDFFGFI